MATLDLFFSEDPQSGDGRLLDIQIAGESVRLGKGREAQLDDSPAFVLEVSEADLCAAVDLLRLGRRAAPIGNGSQQPAWEWSTTEAPTLSELAPKLQEASAQGWEPPFPPVQESGKSSRMGASDGPGTVWRCLLRRPGRDIREGE